ncbi:DUF6318 family protein [Nocardioides aquiterrae]
MADVTGTRAVIAAVGVALVLGVAACSGSDPEPRLAPPSNSAPSTPSTSPVATSLDPAGTVQAWIAAQNDALSTGDTAGLRALGAKGCRGCADFVKPIERVYADGGHFDTEGWSVIAAKTRPGSDNPAVVDVAVSIAGGRTTPKAGADPVVYGRQKRIMLFKLVPAGGRLLVNFVGFVE